MQKEAVFDALHLIAIFAIDLATLPVRLCTLLPRMIYQWVPHRRTKDLETWQIAGHEVKWRREQSDREVQGKAFNYNTFNPKRGILYVQNYCMKQGKLQKANTLTRYYLGS